MSSPPAQPDPHEGKIGALLAAEDDRQRARLLADDPGLGSRETVRALVALVNGALRVDLGRAGRAASALAWLAQEIGDDESRGLAHRVRGNVLAFRREYSAALPEYETALRLLSRAGARTEEAIARSAVVGTLSHLGSFERALEMAAAAKRTFDETGDLLRLAILENQLAHLETRRERFREALAHYQAALAHFRTQGQPSHIGITLRNIAVCHQFLNDFPRALEAYDQAAEYCREHDLPLVAAEVEYNIAYLYYLRGEYEQANRLFEEARVTSRSLGDRQHEALCDLDQAEIFLELNLVGEAGRLAARACAGFDELGMEYEAAKAMTYQALAMFRQREPREAAELLARAGERFAAQKNRFWVAVTELHRAFVLFDATDLSRAAALAGTAREAFEESGLHRQTVLSEILLARLALAAGETEEAGRWIARALGRLAGLSAPQLRFQAHFVAGLVAEASGRPGEALDSFRRSATCLEELRHHLKSEELRIAFLEDKVALYEGLVTLSLAAAEGPADPEAAFAWAEKAKSRSMADLLAAGGWIPPSAKDDTGLVDEMKELREELNWFYRQIDREELRVEGRSLERLDRLGVEASRREEQLQRLRRKLRTRQPELGWLDEAATADLEGVRSALSPDSQVLEYFIARGVVHAFLLDRRRLEVRQVSTVRRLVDLRQKLRFQLDRFQMGEEYVRGLGELPIRATLSYLGQLYDELIRPLEPDLEAHHLVLVPHGLLHGLPIHALFDGERYLLDRFSVSYTPSATVFRLCCRRPVGTAGSALVLGGKPELVLATGPLGSAPQSVLNAVLGDGEVDDVELVTLESLAETDSGSNVAELVAGLPTDLTLSGTWIGPETAYFSNPMWNGYAAQTALIKVVAQATHLLPAGEAMGAGVVAVIDTGVDPSHPLLASALVPGYDFILDQPGIPSEYDALADPLTTQQNLEAAADQSFSIIVEGNGVTDSFYPAQQPIVDQSFSIIVETENLPAAFGHGTMVAGIIRIMAPAAQIMPIRAFDGEGVSDMGRIVQAINWAVDNGANVINLSFSASSDSKELSRALSRAKRKGVVCVSSAGNKGDSSLTYPAGHGNVLGVASTDLFDNISAFSSRGADWVTVGAPGEEVITLYPGGGYAAAWGTSFSAAFVSGAVALLHEFGGGSNLNTIDYNQSDAAIWNSADAPWGGDLGAGRLNAYSAFQCGPKGLFCPYNNN